MHQGDRLYRPRRNDSVYFVVVVVVKFSSLDGALHARSQLRRFTSGFLVLLCRKRLIHHVRFRPPYTPTEEGGQ